GIEEGNEFPFGVGEAAVASGPCPVVSLVEGFERNGFEFTAEGFQIFLDGGVGGAVIADENLERLHGLIGDALECPCQGCNLIVNGDDDGDGRGGHNAHLKGGCADGQG